MTEQKQAPAEKDGVVAQEAPGVTKDSIADSALDKVAGGRVGAPARRNTRLF